MALKTPTASRVFAAALAVLGVWAGWSAVQQINRVWEIRRWSIAEGKVLTVEIVKLLKPGKWGSTTYHPVIRYEYRVDGHPFLSEAISPLPLRWNEDETIAFARDHAPGSKVAIFRNPVPAEHSFLIAKVTDGYALLVIGVLLIACGCWLSWNTQSKRESKPVLRKPRT